MMTNIQVAEQLRYVSLLLEYLEGPSFPVRRFSEMARIISVFDFPLILFRTGQDLRKIASLFFPKARGEQLDVLRGFLDEQAAPSDPVYTRKTGLSYHSAHPLTAALEKEVPLDTAELILLPEMGAQRAAQLRDQLEIKTVSDLLLACKRHLIRKLEGFDQELEKKWSLGRWYSDQPADFPPQPRPSAEPFVSFILEQLQQLTAVYPEQLYPTPWEQVRFSETASPQPDEHHFRPNPWDAPIMPIPNIRQRRSLTDRVRNFLTKRNDTRFTDPSFTGTVPAFSEGRRPVSASIPPLAVSIEPVGEFRRLEETIHTFDFLITTPDPYILFDRIAKLSFLRITKRSADQLDAVVERGQLVRSDDRKLPGASIRIFAAPPHSRIAKSVYLSSDPAHWKELTKRAQDAGLLLDSTGLFRSKTEEVQLHTDTDLYQTLFLPAYPPEVRNGLFEFSLNPEILIRRDQIKGDLHLHSVFTDGEGTLEQMVDKALAGGLEYIAMTDHSKRVSVANGMDEKRIFDYWAAIDQLNERIRDLRIPFRVLKGVEVDILGNAVLDFSDDILSHADWVQASLHFEQGQPRDQIHRRLTAAFQSPYVSAVSHPTGKTWQSSFRIDMDYGFLFDMAKKYNKCLEMNSQPRRFDLDWRLCREAKERGVKIVISTDSHAPDEMDFMTYGVQLARKAGLTSDDIINTLPVEEILARRPRRAE